MHIRRRHRSAPKYTYTQGSEPTSAKKALNLTLLLTLAALCLFLSGAVMFLKTLSSQIAVSDASDIVIDKVNSAIADILASGDYDGDYFVSFEKNSSGEITAISSNMARINALSAQILDRVVGAATDTHTLTVKIPGREPDRDKPPDGARPSGPGADHRADVLTCGVQQQHCHCGDKPDEAPDKSQRYCRYRYPHPVGHRERAGRD